MNWAKNIKKLREKMLVTQTEFSTILGVSYVSINRWENGVYDPTMKAKRKLMELFKKFKINMEE